MKQEILVKLNNFFIADIQEDPKLIFSILKEIIDFDSARIYLSDKLTYSINPQINCDYTLKEELKVKKSPFGHIEILRDYAFSQDESTIFQTCTSIIASLVKDIELTKIINLQVKALQEGIKEKDSAYKDAKETNNFFANFSHELRTPLNCIISSSELLSEQIFGKLNEKQAEYINDIRVSGLHLLGMINDILDMAKLESKLMKANKTEFELDILLDEVCNTIHPLAMKKNIEIIKKYPKNSLLYADRVKIQQVIFNLLTNAIKYTPQNGNVTISVLKNGTKTILKIRDNGIGIEKKFHKKIFEKFAQLENQANSNGLGLTIVKEIIKLHNGKISLESIPNKGTEFIITI